MKNDYILFLFYLCFISFQTNANNDKYRLTIANDPATTITIGWNQTSGNNPQVHFGTTDYGTNYTQYNTVKGVDRSVSFRGMNNNFARLTGLTPNTNYYFVIHDSQGTSQRFWFRTAPDDLSRLSFISGGDSRNNRTPRQRANLLVSKLKPHAVFFGGDMTDDDTSGEWQDWFDDWQLTTSSDGRMIPIVAARGNHEYDSSTIYNLFDTPNQDAYYAVTFGDNLIRTYTLNSEISVLGNQLSWLQNDLNNSSNVQWKMAQYHKPMRPHTSSKSEGNDIYSAWAQLFYDKGVNLVVDCDSHTVKTTFPLKPSNGPNSDEGFEIDNQFGTVYTGEGTWGAPLRPNNDDKTWTRSSGSFNQFKLIFIDENKIELRTIKVDNASSVAENPNNDPFQLPNNLDVFSPSTGAVVTILSNSNNCPDAGTACDDGDSSTLNDEEDGFCNCSGIPQGGAINILVADDAEEGENGNVYLDSSDLELVFDSFNNQNNQTVGLRFANIPLPNNVTINSAYIQFTADESDSGNTSLNIRGEDSGNSSFFSSSNNNITNRNLTSAQVSWNNIPSWSTGDSGFDQRTPDLSLIITEVLSNSSWAINNAITFIISGSGDRVAESTEGSSSNAARLILNYSISVPNTCNPPTNLNSSNVTIDSVDLSWGTATQASNGYEWLVMADGVSPNINNALANGSTSNNSIQITGLSDNTDYDAYTRSICDSGEESGWSSVLNFATLEDICEVPTNLSISNISGSSASLSWNTQTTVSNGYQWVVMADGVSPNSATAQFTGSTSNLTIQVTGLSNLTTYDAYVQSDCGNGDIGNWSSVSEFTINNCPPAGTACQDGNPNTINDIEDGSCNCSGVIPGGSINVLVTDDVEQGENGSIYFDSSDIELVFDSYDDQNNQTVGLRFTNIELPDNASITNAYIQFTADETDTGNTNLIINGEYSGNASAFSGSNNNVSNRTTTSNSVEVSWNNVPAWNSVGQNGADQRTPNLSGVVQEIVNHPSWVSSNAMVFIITGNGSRAAESLDGTASSAARLIVDYSIVPIITCNAPIGLESSNLTTDSASLSWSTQPDASSGYEWVVMANGVSPNPTTAYETGTTLSTSIQINGLTDNTSYDVYVRSNCDNGDVSDWSVAEEFTTVIICNEPTNLTSSNLTTDGLGLSWDTEANANSGYQWVVMADGITPNPATAQATGTSANEFVQISGLSDNTSFEAYVRSNCGNGVVSDWSIAVEFTTIEICIEPSNLSSTNITIDSVDLSWNGSANASDGYEWIVMADDIPPNIATALTSGTTLNTSAQVSGLSNFTTYDAYVRSNCGNGNVSIWSVVEKFSINICPPAGIACDDGDDCTSEDVSDGNCNCIGVFQDVDNDGTCDADDICEGGDDNIDNNNNDIPDDCEDNCSYILIDFNNFDSGWGIWNDGGRDCRKSSNDASYSFSGARSVRLRDNTSSSVMTTDDLNLDAYDELTLSFTYFPRSMDNSNEDFWLQISTNGGSSYSIVEEWNRGDEFENNVREFDTVTISGPFTSVTRLRFRCDASGNGDYIYIDDVEITGCFNAAALINSNAQNEETKTPLVEEKIEIIVNEITEFKFYPNPVSSVLNIELVAAKSDLSNIRIIDILGREKRKVVQGLNKGINKFTLNLDDLNSGFYFIEMRFGEQTILKKLIKR